MSEEEKRVKRLKRANKDQTSENTELLSPASINLDTSDPHSNMDFPLMFHDTNVPEMNHVVEKQTFHEHFANRIQEYFQQDSATTQPKEISPETGQMNGPETTFEKMAAAEYSINNLRVDKAKDKSLNSLEVGKLQELLAANESLNINVKVDMQGMELDLRNPSLKEIARMTDHAIRKFINMCKRISAFKNLCQEDQIALLKGSCAELMILRSVMAYDRENGCWQDSVHNPLMKMDVLKLCSNGDLYENHRILMESFHAPEKG